MQWQDLVITVGQVIFSIALIPMILDKNKPALISSIMNGSVLLVFALTFTTLSLWFSAIVTSITGTLWFILAFQKHLKDRRKI